MSDHHHDRVSELVHVERPATGGGVGRLDDGRVIFVRHSLPGEVVRVEITETTSSFARGEAIEVVEASAQRVTAPCAYAHAGGCGGCDLQHADAALQTSWKAALVSEHLQRIAGIGRSVVVEGVAAPPEGSRTRLRCGVSEDGQLGLRAARSHDLVTIESCWIADPVFRRAFDTSWHGADEVELRAIGDAEPFAVVRRETPRGTMYELCTLAGEPIEPSTRSRVAVDGHYFSVSPRSFWQSHRSAPELLVKTVTNFAQVAPGDHVVDLFSGVGLFTVPLAKIVGPGGRVSAVESSPHAVRDARENADSLRQVKVREWRVAPRAINDAVGAGDVVVLDPPRGGLARGVAEAILRRVPRRLVYVSCDPATFARDVKIFESGGMKLSDLKVFDLFPMTEHVELVGLLDTGL